MVSVMRYSTVYYQFLVVCWYIIDCEFLVTIQGPFPLFEVSSMQITRTTTIASIKENIMKIYDYNSSKQFDLLYNGISLVNSNIEKHGITENDILIVTERIGQLVNDN